MHYLRERGTVIIVDSVECNVTEWVGVVGVGTYFGVA